jgi:hypothetical protein
LRWTATERPRGFAKFAVFIDRVPVAPGRSIDSIADDACKRRPNCPDATYLRSLNVYLTTEPRLEILTVPLVPGISGRAKEPTHTASVVYIDTKGRRVGGAVDMTTFRVSA